MLIIIAIIYQHNRVCQLEILLGDIIERRRVYRGVARRAKTGHSRLFVFLLNQYFEKTHRKIGDNKLKSLNKAILASTHFYRCYEAVDYKT